MTTLFLYIHFGINISMILIRPFLVQKILKLHVQILIYLNASPSLKNILEVLFHEKIKKMLIAC
jgi:hypothetical protein